MDAQPAPTRSRVGVLDGLRGATIILVVINHAWILWPRDQIDQVPLIRGIFQGGSVVVFFVIGGFIVSLNLMREQARGVMDPMRFWLRRIVRVGVQLVPACAAIIAIHRFDPTDPFSDTATTRSVVNVLTYTWNQYAVDHVFEARSDLGHLWYLSVQQQCYLLLPLLLLAFSRHRKVLAGILALTAAVVVVHRFQVVAEDGWFRASLLTTTRSDGLILGVVAALILGFVARWKARANAVALACTVTMVGLLLLSGEIDPLQYLREWGVAFTLVSVVLVVALYYVTDGSWASRIYSTPVLQYLGRASLPIYVWHLIIFETVARHAATWEWEARSVLAFALLAAVSVTAQRFIEEPTRVWLRRSSWFRAPMPSPEAHPRHAEGGVR
jgi:peptidoglycan/LPS O-acetylase OafA/YrhL